MNTNSPNALVVEYVPPRRDGPALAIVECPLPACPPVKRGKRKGGRPLHIHGLGPAGSDHRALLTDRAGHCLVRSRPGGYTLWDRDHLVPEQVTSC